MTAASSRLQAQIQIRAWSGSGATTARPAAAAPMPMPTGQRRASGPAGPVRRRVPGAGVPAVVVTVLVTGAPSSERDCFGR